MSGSLPLMPYDMVPDDDSMVSVDKLAFEAVVAEWENFCDATNPVSQARAIIALNNAMGDLESYHPGWDIHTGSIWPPEEEY